MPFRSKSQQRFICATDPKLCKKFASETPKSAYKSLPEKIRKRKK